MLYDTLARPGCTLNLLGAAIPATATYFAQLVVVKALSGLMVELSRPTSLLQVRRCSAWHREIEREETKTENGGMRALY